MSDSKQGADPVGGTTEKSVSFEASLEQLESIVDQLEEGQLGLEPSLVRFEEGIRLLRSCHAILENAERRIEVLTGFATDGSAQLANFDAQATFEETGGTALRPARRRVAGKSATNPEENMDDF
ncbi:MAG: exodeoxyribonuclease VII small subunit [Planctomycetota bacterium]|nr:exodeoxyribonuclease VII small subunit [Planctomycetota bacterium]